jgi:CheY-like chemotaxis protein
LRRPTRAPLRGLRVAANRSMLAPILVGLLLTHPAPPAILPAPHGDKWICPAEIAVAEFVKIPSQARCTPNFHKFGYALPTVDQTGGVHGGALLIPSSSVLIVDRSDESREVLRTALQRRGVRIFEAARADDGLALARSCHPDLIVLDLETAPADEGPAAAEFAAVADGRQAPLVLLGSARRRTAGQASSGTPARAGQFVAKPYHYQPLILKIERLLRDSRQAA